MCSKKLRHFLVYFSITDKLVFEEYRCMSEKWQRSQFPKWKCAFCNSYFRTEEEKDRHVEEVHPDH